MPYAPRQQTPRLRRSLQEPRSVLASGNRRSKDICIFPVIVAELKFCNIERHVFGTGLVEASNYTALENRPEAFNRVRMNRADDILPSGMVVRHNALSSVVVSRRAN